ncbi:hypothetical protein BT96DRAFT_110094 [Gymnopus androsaceus JB14]|uniref:Uncharacterized protein n=1 Tax=Gymnopus androsaceus JB14 TaxID=1447944 RepID=A0A6A4HHF1_9AGAR|nr:hypothetical protein BT96DRAFT_110094 [Gymnopus androsaceus JB14]
MVSEIPPDPQPSPFPALTLSNARYQSQRPDTLDHPQSSFAAYTDFNISQHTRALKEERQLEHVESANEDSPVACTEPRSGSSIRDLRKAHAVQSTPSPFFGASSRTSTVVPRLRPAHYPFQLHTPTSRELQSSNPPQSGRSYCLTTRKRMMILRF